MPVLIHSYDRSGGNLRGELAPGDIAHLARRYPSVSIIAAHLGGLWQCGPRVVRLCANVYMDVCGSRAYVGMVEHAVDVLGAERVLFGSDAYGRTFVSQLAKVVGAEIDIADKRRILWDNSARLFFGEEGGGPSAG